MSSPTLRIKQYKASREGKKQPLGQLEVLFEEFLLVAFEEGDPATNKLVDLELPFHIILLAQFGHFGIWKHPSGLLRICTSFLLFRPPWLSISLYFQKKLLNFPLKNTK